MTAHIASAATGIEYEYKWCIDDLAGAADPARPDMLDDWFLAALDNGSDAVNAAHRDPFTFAQSALHFDTPRWELTEAGLSLTAAVNYGARAGTGGLMVKETVRWSGARREALEVSELVPTRELSRRIRDVSCVPIDRLRRRLPAFTLPVSPFAKVVQRRRKAVVELPSGAELGISLDSSHLTTVDDTHTTNTRWWLEIEVNSGDRTTLGSLDAFMLEVRKVLARDPERRTKPQVFATVAGWRGTPR